MKYLIEILKTLGFDKSILEELGKYIPVKIISKINDGNIG